MADKNKRSTGWKSLIRLLVAVMLLVPFTAVAEDSLSGYAGLIPDGRGTVDSARYFDFAYSRGKSYRKMPALRLQEKFRLDKPAGVAMAGNAEGGQTVVCGVKLPGYVSGVFFSRDDRPGDFQWPNNTNRLMPWPFRTLGDLNDRDYPGIPSNAGPSLPGDALLLKLADDEWILLKAVAGKNSLSCLQVDAAGELDVYTSTLGKDSLGGSEPAFIYAQGSSPFLVFREVYEKLRESVPENRADFRERKEYYEAFEYLGWCSWEHYHFDIDQQKLLEDLKCIEASPLPVRFVLIDDGHLQNKAQMLTSFQPDGKKFPDGWTRIMEVKKRNKIKWVGLWYNFTGYWQGISPENDFPESVRHSLYPYRGTLLPGRTSDDITRFYRYYLSTLKNYGFDFLKIDNQSFMLPLYMGGNEAVRQARDCNIALEREAHRLKLGLVNCMAQNVLNIDNTLYSSVSRVSIDYKKFDRAMAKSHLYQSYVNTLLQGQTVWPDHDMFHSCDSVCGEMMARSKAVSGGPVYLSDAPADFKAELVEPLVDKRGKVFRPAAPAVPYPADLGVNPIFGGKAFRVFAPVGDEAMAVVCYNLNDTSVCDSVETEVKAVDYCLKDAFSGGGEGVCPDKMLVYDWKKGDAHVLEEQENVVLKGFSDRLLFLCPVRQGWAVVGLAEKYLSPATVQIVSRTRRKLVVDVLESGHLKVWEDGEEGGKLHTIKVECGKRGKQRIELKYGML